MASWRQRTSIHPYLRSTDTDMGYGYDMIRYDTDTSIRYFSEKLDTILWGIR